MTETPNTIGRRGRLTDEDRAEILRLAADPRIGQRVVRSIAPSNSTAASSKTWTR